MPAEPEQEPTRWEKGRFFEEMTPGRRFVHRRSRTITETDALLFSTSTLAFDPLHLSRPAALAAGHRDIVVNPWLVLCYVVGMTVEDLSERGGAFLGLDDVHFLEPVHIGDTVRATSVVVTARPSSSRPECGVATWRTEGFWEDGTQVIDLLRTNLVRRAAA
jgi:acyl dehydratase